MSRPGGDAGGNPKHPFYLTANGALLMLSGLLVGLLVSGAPYPRLMREQGPGDRGRECGSAGRRTVARVAGAGVSRGAEHRSYCGLDTSCIGCVQEEMKKEHRAPFEAVNLNASGPVRVAAVLR
jgi:hypothetical protein